MTQAPCIVWFKRDLRINDHAPLLKASQSGAPIIPLYIVEPEYWKQPFASRRHWHFIHDCLRDLDIDLAALGQQLIVKVGDACEVIKELHFEHRVSDVYAHEETGNLWTYRRDIAVQKLCLDNNIALHEAPTNGVVRRLRSRDDWSEMHGWRKRFCQSPMRCDHFRCASPTLYLRKMIRCLAMFLLLKCKRAGERMPLLICAAF